MGTYPFAGASVNVTFMLIKIFGLEAMKSQAMVVAIFLKFLSTSKFVLDLLHRIVFKLMEHKWLAMHASHANFNIVMKSIKRPVGREFLLQDVSCLEDSPSYSLPTQKS